MSDVTRWDLTKEVCAWFANSEEVEFIICADKKGAYVKYSDYESLQAELKEAEQKLRAHRITRASELEENKRLQAKLDTREEILINKRKLIDKLQEELNKHRWRKVEDELPAESQIVDVFAGGDRLPYRKYEGGEFYSYGLPDEHGMAGYNVLIEYVSHWKPITPPEE